MAEPRRGWINGVVGAVGAIVFAIGILGLTTGLSTWDTFVAVFGFIVMGWAVLDYRRFRRGTPESEVGGGHTIE
jgi:hypothetical protein